MNKNIFILAIFTVILCFSCKNRRQLDVNIETIILTIHNSRFESKPLNLILSFTSKKVIIYNSSLIEPSIPPPPIVMARENESFNDGLLDYESEVFELETDVEKDILTIINNFDKEDYNNKFRTALDGAAITINIFYADNEYRKIVLVNDSSPNHRKLFNRIFQYVQSKTEQNDLIQLYVPL